jgi:hypothetical protein
MTDPEPDRNDGEQSSVAGCLLMLVCVAVIGAVALYLATWRDADSGRPLPRNVAIFVPLLAGAVCYGIGTAILRIVGLPVFLSPEKDSSDGADDSKATQTDDR